MMIEARIPVERDIFSPNEKISLAQAAVQRIIDSDGMRTLYEQAKQLGQKGLEFASEHKFELAAASLVAADLALTAVTGRPSYPEGWMMIIGSTTYHLVCQRLKDLALPDDEMPQVIKELEENGLVDISNLKYFPKGKNFGITRERKAHITFTLLGRDSHEVGLRYDKKKGNWEIMWDEATSHGQSYDFHNRVDAVQQRLLEAANQRAAFFSCQLPADRASEVLEKLRLPRHEVEVFSENQTAFGIQVPYRLCAGRRENLLKKIEKELATAEKKYQKDQERQFQESLRAFEEAQRRQKEQEERRRLLEQQRQFAQNLSQAEEQMRLQKALADFEQETQRLEKERRELEALRQQLEAQREQQEREVFERELATILAQKELERGQSTHLVLPKNIRLKEAASLMSNLKVPSFQHEGEEVVVDQLKRELSLSNIGLRVSEVQINGEPRLVLSVPDQILDPNLIGELVSQKGEDSLDVLNNAYDEIQKQGGQRLLQAGVLKIAYDLVDQPGQEITQGLFKDGTLRIALKLDEEKVERVLSSPLQVGQSTGEERIVDQKDNLVPVEKMAPESIPQLFEEQLPKEPNMVVIDIAGDGQLHLDVSPGTKNCDGVAEYIAKTLGLEMQGRTKYKEPDDGAKTIYAIEKVTEEDRQEQYEGTKGTHGRGTAI